MNLNLVSLPAPGPALRNEELTLVLHPQSSSASAWLGFGRQGGDMLTEAFSLVKASKDPLEHPEVLLQNPLFL